MVVTNENLWKLAKEDPVARAIKRQALGWNHQGKRRRG
jgi:hypothetical protein